MHNNVVRRLSKTFEVYKTMNDFIRCTYTRACFRTTAIINVPKRYTLFSRESTEWDGFTRFIMQPF